MAILQFNRRNNYSDKEYVDGVFHHQQKMENALYSHCKRYFNDKFQGVFFCPQSEADKIFHEAFITLWQNIENRKLYVEDGILKGKDGEPFKGQLTTYLMSIARNKYREWVRDGSKTVSLDPPTAGSEEGGKEINIPADPSDSNPWLQDNPEDEMFEILSSCISQMPERCRQILTLFYYEAQTLEQIMQTLTTFTSKDALKTAKNKCMNKLKESANSIYLNSLI